MFIQMMVMLAVASTLVELMFAAKFKVWRLNAHKFKWVNMTISILLSFILGQAFGAVGLIALGAAVLSTVMSVPGYAFLNWNYDTPMAARQGGNRMQFYWKNFHVHWAKWRKVLADFNQLMYSIFLVITLPVRVFVKCYKFIQPYIVKFNAFVEGRRATRTVRP
jgi:hypothetical protein